MLAEEEENVGVKLMDTLDDFNSCLSSEGYEFIGLPNQEGGPEDPANNPDYLRALVLCNSRTNIATTFQEFQESYGFENKTQVWGQLKFGEQPATATRRPRRAPQNKGLQQPKQQSEHKKTYHDLYILGPNKKRSENIYCCAGL